VTDRYLDTAIKAAKTSGQILTDYFEKLHDCRQKNQNIRDLVTEVDILSEKNIKEIISAAFPDQAINAEESPLEGKRAGEFAKIWHIDPLDGTVNYSQGIPLCAVSIAFEENGEVMAGVIFNPFSEELFFAAKGQGACLNGQPISVSKKNDLKEGVYVAGFSSASSAEKRKEYETFGRINDATRGVLRLGSAALALAYLACGRIDGFWAKKLHPWDLAAGIVLVGEAQGRVSNVNNEKYSFKDDIFVATNTGIHLDLLKELKGLGSESTDR
jgi:myo-inositol-1(or 4)-monophosphatase